MDDPRDRKLYQTFAKYLQAEIEAAVYPSHIKFLEGLEADADQWIVGLIKKVSSERARQA